MQYFKQQFKINQKTGARTKFQQQMDFELEILPLPVSSAQNTNTFLHTICDNNNNMNVNSNHTNGLNLNLQQQAMLNQFVSIAGCSFDQGLYLLSSSNWQYQVNFSSQSKKTLFKQCLIFILLLYLGCTECIL